MNRLVAGLLLACALLRAAEDTERRRAYLDQVLALLAPSSDRDTARINAVDKTWEQWQTRTGELPPDFSALPSIAALPDPLRLRNTSAIRTRAQWDEQRRWIRSQFETWIFGRMPPAPDNLRAKVLSTEHAGAATVRNVLLEFGPERRATLRLTLTIPDGPGPHPVFLTNHPPSRPWIAPAVRRGYIGCIFYASDPVYGSPDDSDKYIEVYPEYDFSALARWAWAAMRAVDYLVAQPEVDARRIALAGHSRNGKMALLAAAFDERIGAVVESSGNTGGVLPWRYTSDIFVAESLERITGVFPGWFHPRLRFFAGREDKLPVDQNSLMALVAPRGLLLASSYSESQGNWWGIEQAYRSVQSVYSWLGHPEKVGLSLRPGEHPTQAEDIEEYVDFFDHVFGRPGGHRPETSIGGFVSQNRLRPATKVEPKPGGTVQERFRSLLGEEPPAAPFPNRTRLQARPLTSEGYIAGVLGRPLKIPDTAQVETGFGDDLNGTLFLPAGADGKPRPGKHPVIVWLHPYAYQTGWSRNIRPTVEAAVARGFALFAFDQIGFGTRVHQRRRFYDRYPNWSLLGKMIADTRAAVDAVLALEVIDGDRVYLAGFALGGKVAIWSAALDKRVKAVVAASAFDLAGAGAVEHYTRGKSDEDADYAALLSAIAPRPVYLRAPLLDRFATPDGVRAQTAGHGNVLLETPLDFARFGPDAQRKAFDWLAGLK